MSKIAIFQFVARVDSSPAGRPTRASRNHPQRADAAHARWQTDGSGYWACSDQFVNGEAKGSRYYPRNHHRRPVARRTLRGLAPARTTQENGSGCGRSPRLIRVRYPRIVARTSSPPQEKDCTSAQARYPPKFRRRSPGRNSVQTRWLRLDLQAVLSAVPGARLLPDRRRGDRHGRRR